MGFLYRQVTLPTYQYFSISIYTSPGYMQQMNQLQLASEVSPCAVEEDSSKA